MVELDVELPEELGGAGPSMFRMLWHDAVTVNRMVPPVPFTITLVVCLYIPKGTVTVQVKFWGRVEVNVMLAGSKLAARPLATEETRSTVTVCTDILSTWTSPSKTAVASAAVAFTLIIDGFIFKVMTGTGLGAAAEKGAAIMRNTETHNPATERMH